MAAKKEDKALTKVTVKAPTLTKELKDLDDKIVETYNSAEKEVTALYVLLAEAHTRRLYLAKGHATMSEYLVGRLGVSKRSAQHLALTIQVFIESNIDMKTFKELGPTRSRELASYVARAKPTPKTVQAVVDKVLKENWTADQIQQYAHQQLARQGVATDGRGKDLDKEPRTRRSIDASDSQWDSILESNEQAFRLTGSADLATNIELSLRDFSLTATEDAESAISAARKSIDNARRLMGQAISSALDLSDGKPAEQRQGEKLFASVTELALAMLMAAGEYLNSESEVDENFLIKAIDGNKSQRNMDDYRDNAANIVTVLADAFGVDRKSAEKFVMLISPTRVIDATA